jgi:hypothetical protein
LLESVFRYGGFQLERWGYVPCKARDTFVYQICAVLWCGLVKEKSWEVALRGMTDCEEGCESGRLVMFY